jgi:hypothetical protein
MARPRGLQAALRQTMVPRQAAVSQQAMTSNRQATALQQAMAMRSAKVMKALQAQPLQGPGRAAGGHLQRWPVPRCPPQGAPLERQVGMDWRRCGLRVQAMSA